MYGRRGLKLLKIRKCKSCLKRYPSWSNEIYTSWLRYVNGADRDTLIKNTEFSGYTSLKYHFKKHECYKKISQIRKKWFRPIKGSVHINIKNHPWLLGLFYADGTKSNSNSRLSFFLSSHEDIIARQVIKELRKVLDKNSHLSYDTANHMIAVRVYNVDLCDTFPNKKDKHRFLDIWSSFTIGKKLRFIAGFIDGDGSCSFEDKIDSIQLYSKCVPFVLKPFYQFLSRYGYVSLQKYMMYISPTVGRVLKKYILKRKIRKKYSGSVDTIKVYGMLKNGLSARKIAKITNYDKKTILLTLRRVYGKEVIRKLLKNKLRKNKI